MYEFSKGQKGVDQNKVLQSLIIPIEEDSRQRNINADSIPEMIPIREASKRTGLSYDFLRKACLRGEIVHVRAGQKILINFNRLCDYLNTAGIEK